jgi:hypothetical protein
MLFENFVFPELCDHDFVYDTLHFRTDMINFVQFRAA